MSSVSQLCACIDFDEEIIKFNVFINNVVYHNTNKNKIVTIEFKKEDIKKEIETPDIKIEIEKKVKNEITPKEEITPEITPEVKVEEIKTEVKKTAKTAAERQRERRARLKEQMGEEEFKKKNQQKMREYRAKQKKEKNEEVEEENIDDDNLSTTSSNTNNKVRSDENTINCECGTCYHKSYKARHLNSKAHIEGLKKNEVKTNLDNKYDMAIKFVNKYEDNDRHSLNLHPNIYELYDEINKYINMYMNRKSTQKQLYRNVNLEIKEFMDNNDIKYTEDLFYKYLNEDSCSESENSESESD